MYKYLNVFIVTVFVVSAALNVCILQVYADDIGEPFAVGGKVGFKNSKGEIFIDPEYEGATSYLHYDTPKKQYFAAVKVKGKWGMIDPKGKFLIDPAFDSIGNFSDDGHFDVTVDGKHGLIDCRGTYVLDPVYSSVIVTSRYGYGGVHTWVFNKGIANQTTAFAEHDHKNRTMNLKISYDTLAENTMTSGKLKKVRVSGLFGYMGEGDKLLIPAEYEDAGDFSENRAKVKVGGKWGFIDENGKMVIRTEYDDAYDFKNGFARVKLGSVWGFVKDDGNIVVEPKYNYCWDYSGGKAKVRLEGGDVRHIDREGNLIK